MLPFTTEEFFEVFARYNTVIWPAQIGAAALGLFALILLFRSGPVGSRVSSLILAAFWLLMGIGYHLLFFTRINTLAYAFGLLFVAQAALLFVDGVIRPKIMFRAEPGWRAWFAWALIAYGLVIYPLIGLFGSHRNARPWLPILIKLCRRTNLAVLGSRHTCPSLDSELIQVSHTLPGARPYRACPILLLP